VARQVELENASRLIVEPAVRLLTLTGPGGVGKTRLALAAAERVRDAFEAVLFVDLAPVREPRLVLNAISEAMSVAEIDMRLLREGVSREPTEPGLLVVLDTCEHVLAAAPQLARLLETSPRLKVLATSREPLRLRWEHQYAVRPLLLPTDRDAGPGELERVPAVALFLERARAVRPEFRLDARNAASVVEMCRQLDGLPLALELAAARTKILAPAAIVARTTDRLDLLRTDTHDAAARHRTLRASMDWSHDLLDPAAQALFRRLAVFRGELTAAAAQAVCATTAEHGSLLDALEQLVDKSLLQACEGGEGQPRFRMLETIRGYALERLVASPDAGEVQQRFARFYLELAERAAHGLGGRDQLTWIECLAREYDNLRAALDWCASAEGDDDTGLRLGSALLRYWTTRGRLREAEQRLEAVLERGGGSAGPRATALAATGVIAALQGDHVRARRLNEEALRLWQDLADQRGVATAFENLGTSSIALGALEEGSALHTSAFEIRVALGDMAGQAQSLHSLAVVAQRRGDLQRASSLLSECLELYRSLGDTQRFAGGLETLGGVLRQQGDDARARSVYEQSLTLRRQLGDRLGMATVLLQLAWQANAETDHGRATALAADSLRLSWEVGARWHVAECLELLGILASGRSKWQRAYRLLSAGEALRETLGQAHQRADAQAYARARAELSAALGGTAFAKAWAAGRGGLLEDAVQYALAGAPRALPAVGAAARVSPTSARDAAAARLTQREREIASLVARGLSNREVAEELVISRETAAVHVKHILRKLGFTSRAQIAAWAVQQGLGVLTWGQSGLSERPRPGRLKRSGLVRPPDHHITHPPAPE
jgi:non-specific serine/threonine protein kinase